MKTLISRFLSALLSPGPRPPRRIRVRRPRELSQAALIRMQNRYLLYSAGLSTALAALVSMAGCAFKS